MKSSQGVEGAKSEKDWLLQQKTAFLSTVTLGRGQVFKEAAYVPIEEFLGNDYVCFSNICSQAADCTDVDRVSSARRSNF